MAHRNHLHDSSLCSCFGNFARSMPAQSTWFLVQTEKSVCKWMLNVMISVSDGFLFNCAAQGFVNSIVCI